MKTKWYKLIVNMDNNHSVLYFVSDFGDAHEQISALVSLGRNIKNYYMEAL